MILNLKKVLTSCIRVVAAVLCGTIFVILVSIVFPEPFSAYGLFGILINIAVSLFVLTYAEIFEASIHRERMKPKHLLSLMMLTSMVVALTIQLWVYVKMSDSQMTSSLDGVLMRLEGKLTIDGWMNLAEFTLSVPLISLVFSFCYLFILRIWKSTIQ